MPNNYLITVILPEFIKILQNYNANYGRLRATVDHLYRAKHANASLLQLQLQKVLDTGDVSVFNETSVITDTNILTLERAASRQSNLTMPSRGTQTSEWAATPMPRPVLFIAGNTDEDWAPLTPAVESDDIITDEADNLSMLSAIIKRERKKIHKLRAGYKTGSLDGILYAMSRSIYFIQWFYKEITSNLPVDNPYENTEDIEPNQKKCLDLIWLIASCMCKYSYDRACKRWDDYHINKLKATNYYPLEAKYYINSGLYTLAKEEHDIMAKMDGYGNRIANCLYLLSQIFLEVDKNTQNNSLLYITNRMLDSNNVLIKHLDQNFVQQLMDIQSKITKPLNNALGEEAIVPMAEEIIVPKAVELFNSTNDEGITIEDTLPKPKVVSPRTDSLSPSKIARTQRYSLDS